MKKWIFIIIVISVVFLLTKGKDALSFLSIPDITKLESVESEIIVNKKAFVKLNEKVVFSPYGGEVRYFFKEGERVAKNTLVVEVKTDNGTFKFFAPESGIFSRKIDEISINGEPDKQKIIDFLESKKAPEYATTGSTKMVKPGEPIFRIVDNINAIIFVLKDKVLEKLIEDREIFIEDEIRNEEVPLYLVSISDKLIQLEIEIHVEDFINNRTPIINIIAYKGKLIRIPERFVKHGGITVKDGDTPLFISTESLFYVEENGYYVFPLTEENKKLFKFLGREIIKE